MRGLWCAMLLSGLVLCSGSCLAAGGPEPAGGTGQTAAGSEAAPRGTAGPGNTAIVPQAGQGEAPDTEALRLAREIVAHTTGDRSATLQAISGPMVGMMQQMGVADPAKAQALVQEAVMPLLGAHIDALIDMEAQSYARALSVDDLRASLAFYESPAGRDLAAAQPMLGQARVSNLTQWIGGLQPEIAARTRQVMKEHGWDRNPHGAGVPK